MCLTCALGAPGLGESLASETLITGAYVVAVSGVFYLVRNRVPKKLGTHNHSK